MVVPISAASLPYARRVRAALRAARFHADVDAADKKMQKKVREAQLAQYNYILVVGADEEAAATVNVRTRDNKVFGQRALADVVALMTREREERALESVAGTAFGEGVAHGRKDGKTAVEAAAA
jgi:threonyl-tRNA synthetase